MWSRVDMEKELGLVKVMGLWRRVPAAVIFALFSSLPSFRRVCLKNWLPVCLIFSILFSIFLIQPTLFNTPHPSLLHTRRGKNADFAVIIQLELLMGAILAVLNSLPTRETEFEYSLSTECVFVHVHGYLLIVSCRVTSLELEEMLWYTWLQVQQWHCLLHPLCLLAIWEV